MSKSVKLTTAAIITVLLIGGFIFWLKQPTKIYSMSGNIVEIKENSVLFSGGFDTEIGTQARNIEVAIDENTRIIRRSLKVPEKGPFKVGDLPKEETNVNVVTMKADATNRLVGMKVILRNDLFGKPRMSASEILYILPDFPYDDNF